MDNGTQDLNWDAILTKMEQIQELHKRASTQGEMEAAANAMGRLLTKYGLELADVEMRLDGRTDKDAHVRVDLAIGSNAQWRRNLLNVIAKHNFCLTLTHRGQATQTIVGRPKYIQATKAMFSWLETEVETLGEYRYMQDGLHTYVAKKSWKNSFYNGMVQGLALALRAAKAQAAADYTGGSSLVIVEEKEAKEAFDGFFPETRPITQRVANNSGFSAGLAEGQRFNLNGERRLSA